MSVVQIMFATLTNPFSNYISYAEIMSFFKKKFKNEKLKSHKQIPYCAWIPIAVKLEKLTLCSLNFMLVSK